MGLVPSVIQLYTAEWSPSLD